jgi:hypothetical protein
MLIDFHLHSLIAIGLNGKPETGYGHCHERQSSQVSIDGPSVTARGAFRRAIPRHNAHGSPLNNLPHNPVGRAYNPGALMSCGEEAHADEALVALHRSGGVGGGVGALSARLGDPSLWASSLDHALTPEQYHPGG